jgi:hypothetical protein
MCQSLNGLSGSLESAKPVPTRSGLSSEKYGPQVPPPVQAALPCSVQFVPGLLPPTHSRWRAKF